MDYIIRYTLDDYKTIFDDMSNLDLPEETIAIINKLALQVGSPGYIKTPQFRNRRNNYHQKAKSNVSLEEDWDAIRNFQITEFIKNEGVDKNIDNIRKILNKLTTNTFIKIRAELFVELAKIDNCDIERVANEIFRIVKNNVLFSDVYAKIYAELIGTNKVFASILEQNIAEFENIIMNSNYVNPEDDYNKLCENNKLIEGKKSVSLFYVNLMKEKEIEPAYIYGVCLAILNRYNILIGTVDKKYEVDELIEIFYIIFKNSYKQFSITNNLEFNSTIITQINLITQYKISDYKSLTNKSLFKFMDIIDETG